jgi:hypothetical protein
MRYFFITLLLLVFFVSCGSSGKKKDVYSNVPKKFITIVENVDSYNAAYTEDGHTLIYKNDSLGDVVVYYAKFENNAGKYGLRGIDEKIIRAEMDSSLGTLKSFFSFSGGAFCEIEEMGYNVYYFDEQMKGALKENIEVHWGSEPSEDTSEEYKMKRIIALLNVAYEIAHSISDKNISGWNNIYYALEPIQEALNWGIIIGNAIYEPRTEKHISRICRMTEELNQYYYSLQEKMISQKVNN